MPATRLLILPSAGWPIDFNRNLNAFKLGLMVQKFVQIGAKVRAALHQADWLKSSDQAERVGITISVKLPMHTAPIDRQMILDFDPARSENHSAPTVHLMYDEQTKRELERQDLSGQEVEVSSNNGTYHLIVQ